MQVKASLGLASSQFERKIGCQRLLGESLHDQTGSSGSDSTRRGSEATLSAVDTQEGGLGLASPREHPTGATSFPSLGEDRTAPPTSEA